MFDPQTLNDAFGRAAAIYDEHAPLARTHSYQPLQAQGEPFEPIAAFGPIERRHYRWDATVTAANWVGLVATFAVWKGHEVFLDAVARIPADAPARFYVVGGPIYRTAGSQVAIIQGRAV